ncbi:hypothetical protein GEMRC1_013788 [Eukaryota sp. GEM-RC1]
MLLVIFREILTRSSDTSLPGHCFTSTCFGGPFVITRKIGNSGYEIASIVTNQKFEVSGYELSPLYPNVLKKHAKKIAAQDLDEYVVSKSLSHEERPDGLWFEVGFAHGIIQMEPLEHLRDTRINDTLLEYAMTHNLKLPPRKRRIRQC